MENREWRIENRTFGGYMDAWEEQVAVNTVTKEEKRFEEILEEWENLKKTEHKYDWVCCY